jgi:nitrite reductase (cytochrome c-552)
LRRNSGNKKFLIAAAGVVLLVILIVVLQVAVRKPYTTIRLADIPEGEYDPAVWGKHYPLEYNSYLRNKEMSPSPTGFGGSEKVQKSIKEPEILVNFKGMPFSVDYSEDRGHVYALEDLKSTKRVNQATPGACMTCKTAQLADIFSVKGWDYARIPLVELLPKLTHPIVCANCHDSRTMQLRVINPAFIEAMLERGIDVKKAPREDMRSYVCGQCHVEYYFVPASKKVVLPWSRGFNPDNMYEYYSTTPNGFAMDWKHPDSEADMLKAQHPDFEAWSGGAHGGSGVSCADCHMPYMKEDGQKYTSHWVTSPMRHVKQSCQTCHTQGEQWLIERVRIIQAGVWDLQRTAGQTVARAHEAIANASKSAGLNKGEIDRARESIRKAQWYWDFVAAENSMGFHNPSLMLSTLGRSIDLANQAIHAAEKAAGRAR